MSVVNFDEICCGKYNKQLKNCFISISLPFFQPVHAKKSPSESMQTGKQKTNETEIK